MRMPLISSPASRGLALIASVLVCISLAACGGSSRPATSGSTSSSSTAASGSALETFLVKSVPASQPVVLKNIKIKCPGGNDRYPVKCHLTATEAIKGSKKTIPVAGTITVTGAHGNSYQYAVNYAPVH